MIGQDKKLTGRQKRQLHFKSLHARSGLNLVSLMDIFTILVFFLLVNSGAQQLPSTHDVKLPTSTSSIKPKENLILTITKTDIVVAGRKVASLSDVIKDKPGQVIPGLESELKFQATNSQLSNVDAQKQHAVTIMGDENIPYKILSKVLATCRKANYTHIDFAAYQEKKGQG